MGKGGEQTPEKSEIREPNGHFAKGNPYGKIYGPLGGRPPGTLDFMTFCRRQAREEGLNIEEWLWSVMKRLFADAKAGNTKAAALIMNHAFEQPNRKGDNVVNVDARSVKVGPPMPKKSEMREYLKQLSDLAKQHGLTDDE